MKLRGSSLLDAFSLFTEWRAVTGAHDDKHHFDRGDQIASPALGGAVEWPGSSSIGSSAFEWGTRYIEILQAPAGARLRVVVEADAAASWLGRVLVWRPGQAVESSPLAFTGSKGQHELVWPADVLRAVVAVSQIDDGSHDVSEMDYDNERPFTLRLEAVGEEGGGGGGGGGAEPSEGGQAGAGPSSESKGCRCGLAGQGPRAGWGWAALVVAAAARWLRRR